MAKIDTWINNELVTVDTDDVWAETFAHWDALVETETAVAIANATVKALSPIAEVPFSLSAPLSTRKAVQTDLF